MKQKLFWIVPFMLVYVSPAFAEPASITGNPIGDGILSTIIYGAIGIVMAFVSFKVVDLITPGDLSKDIAENNNIALALLAGLTVLGVCIIIAAAIAG